MEMIPKTDALQRNVPQKLLSNSLHKKYYTFLSTFLSISTHFHPPEIEEQQKAPFLHEI